MVLVSSYFRASVLLHLIVFFGHRAEMGVAQPPNCTQQLTGLTACAPFVVPGTINAPSSQCCSALQSVTHDCICTTLQIVSRLPSQCSLPPAICPSGS